jgi:hypothetical protein
MIKIQDVVGIKKNMIAVGTHVIFTYIPSYKNPFGIFKLQRVSGDF